ncbi:MAG: hypothetical protein MUF84_15155 [Anaerolineae bacterium]|nr:hypothetical protein [Anaerolineae bacterium]
MRPFTRLSGWALLVLVGVLSGCLRVSPPFEDDFSDPASGWGAASHETYVRGYQQGRYLFQIDVPNWFVWSTSGHTYGDVEVTALMTSAGPADDHFGLLCRYANDAFYYFAISSDGYYAIFRGEANEALVPLTGRAMQRSAAIHADGTENRLMVSCIGSTLSLYANGQLLAQVEDEALQDGDVGMAAGTVARGGTSIWFDNFKAANP